MDNIHRKCYNGGMDKPLYKKTEGFTGEKMVILSPSVVYKDFTHPLTERMYVAAAGYFPDAKYHFVDWSNGNAEYTLLYCADGEGSVRLNGEIHPLYKNEAFIVPKWNYTYFRSSEDKPWSVFWVTFEGGDTALFPLEDYRIVHFTSERTMEHMQTFFGLLLSTLSLPCTSERLAYVSQVMMLILAETFYLDVDSFGDEEQNKDVAELIRYMYANLDKTLTLDNMSGVLGRSKSYVNKIFLKYTKQTPISFFTQIKMKHACSLLRASTLHIREIAQQLGYADQFYFSRTFKKIIGVPPKEYRSFDTVCQQDS